MFCLDGITAPVVVYFHSLVSVQGNNDTVAEFGTYSIDFEMQWSENVTFPSSVKYMEPNIEYENPIGHMYPGPGIHATVFKATFRTETGEYPDGVSYNETALLYLEETDCTYPYTATSQPLMTDAPASSPVPVPPVPVPASAPASSAAAMTETRFLLLAGAMVTIVPAILLL